MSEFLKTKSTIALTTFLLAISPITLMAQSQTTSTFTGRVTDAATGEPIPGVSVFIAGSTSGSSTDESGHYHFETELIGNHYLVYSLVGYQTEPRSINLEAGTAYQRNAELERVTYQLKEVEVISSNKEWRQNFAYFRQHFIGTTEFAKRTKINNPWILEFEREGNQFRSFSDKPMLITNLALGYQIRLELLKFEWDTETNLGVYKVFTHFEEIKANNPFQKREWERNRIKTFLGSRAHFFRSLYHGDWKEKNYLLGTEDDIYPLSEQDLKYYFYTAESPIYQIPDGWKAFRLEDYVTVRYRRKLAPESNPSTNLIWVHKTAGIDSNREDNLFLINEWGLLKDVESVFLHGVWGRNRLANQLPNNFTYSPE
jgi:hypothetical protein